MNSYRISQLKEISKKSLIPYIGKSIELFTIYITLSTHIYKYNWTKLRQTISHTRDTKNLIIDRSSENKFVMTKMCINIDVFLSYKNYIKKKPKILITKHKLQESSNYVTYYTYITKTTSTLRHTKKKNTKCHVI